MCYSSYKEQLSILHKFLTSTANVITIRALDSFCYLLLINHAIIHLVLLNVIYIYYSQCFSGKQPYLYSQCSLGKTFLK